MKTGFNESKKCLLICFLIAFKFNNVLGAVSSCHATLTENSGTFTSPNYPREPQSDPSRRQGDTIQCEWEIRVSSGQDIQLKFGDFNINAPVDECEKGEVEIFEGVGKNKSSIDIYCPLNNPATTMISGNTATVVFRRPAIGFSGRGFLISYIGTHPKQTIADFVTCSDTSEDYSKDEFFTITCPGGCGSLPHHTVIGKSPYRDDSHLCRAAVHAGVISDDFGGRLTVKREPGTVIYLGNTANNITTITGTMWEFHFVFSSFTTCRDDIRLVPNQFSASSFLLETEYKESVKIWRPWKALMSTPGAWSPKDASKPQWLQISLPKVMNITGVLTKGSQKPYTYTREFIVKYSTNNITWTQYAEEGHDSRKTFAGNTNSFSVVRNNFVRPNIIARYIRVYPSFVRRDAFLPQGLKVALTGCDVEDAWIVEHIPSTTTIPTTTTTTTTTSTTPEITTVIPVSNEKENSAGKKNTTTVSNKTVLSDDIRQTEIKVPGKSDVDSKATSLSENSIIIIAIVAALAVTSILLAALVLFLVRKRKNVPKHGTPIPNMTFQKNMTYNSPIGMPYTPTNNNEERKKSDKKRSSSKSVPPNGMAIENQFARNGATIPYDQQPLISGSENRVPMQRSYLPVNNTAAVTAHHQGQADTCSFASDDDHEYQVIPDQLNEYNNQALSHSSKASTGSSVGTRSRGSDTLKCQPNNVWGHSTSPWGKANSVNSRDMTPNGSENYNGFHPNYPSRAVSDSNTHSSNSSKFSLRSGNRSHSPLVAPPIRYSISPKRASSSSNGSSSPGHQLHCGPYYSSVPESQNLSTIRGSEPGFKQSSFNGKNYSSFKSSPSNESYPAVFSPAPNTLPVPPNNSHHTSSFSKGGPTQLDAVHSDANATSPNRANQRRDYDQLYRKNVAAERGGSVVAMTTNNYDKLNLNTAV